ncbi:hypothetical protein BUALT_Bualt01G0063300 [Buddleja alternifolia]|uniref:Uncharacterized protein n=1 Tax=Buddleja alternifolia TaxID=168488 RepID=A0AAV6YBI9_9LAMI|nr:hypothetical protein BUALT_Bualt01G0063300 [Buddleja alternifolia]
MRRSFGGGGRGMGGGSGGGGGMLRNVHRAVRAGVGGAPPEPFSSSGNTITTIARKPKNLNEKKPTSPNTALTLSSSSSSSSGVNNNNSNNNNYGSSAFSSLINLPISAASGASAPTCSDDLDWECVDGGEDERGKCVFYDDFVFGTVPSRDEVQHAVSALQQALKPPSYTHFPKRKRDEDTGKDDVMDEVIIDTMGYETTFSSSAESEMDWIEPSLHLCNSRMLRTHGSDRVYDAFHLLQTEPSVQRMVVSLSSDKAVWDAVLNNEVVKELRGSITHANNKLGESSDEGSDDSNPINDILSWIVVNVKAKILQLFDNITKLVNGVLQLQNDDKRGDTINPLEEKLKTSLLLSVVVLLIVIVTRAQSA